MRLIRPHTTPPVRVDRGRIEVRIRVGAGMFRDVESGTETSMPEIEDEPELFEDHPGASRNNGDWRG